MIFVQCIIDNHYETIKYKKIYKAEYYDKQTYIIYKEESDRGYLLLNSCNFKEIKGNENIIKVLYGI